MSFELKTVGSSKVLYAMAASQEYGVALKQVFTPLFIGIGPVEAAVNLTRTLEQLFVKGELPDYVVSVGSAGSAVLQQTGIYQASSVSYRDMDASVLGFEKGQTPLLDLPVILELSEQVEGIEKASLSTGANVVSGSAYGLINAQMVDMETFALVRACMAYDVPLIALRGISDGKEDLQRFEDWTQYLDQIDLKLADAIKLVEIHIGARQ